MSKPGARARTLTSAALQLTTSRELRRRSQERLRWNQEVLRYAGEVDREKVWTFYPSLYLNVGKSHEDVGAKQEARRLYQLAADGAAVLPEGKLTDTVRRGAAEGLKRTME